MGCVGPHQQTLVRLQSHILLQCLPVTWGDPWLPLLSTGSMWTHSAWMNPTKSGVEVDEKGFVFYFVSVAFTQHNPTSSLAATLGRQRKYTTASVPFPARVLSVYRHWSCLSSTTQIQRDSQRHLDNTLDSALLSIAVKEWKPWF